MTGDREPFVTWAAEEFLQAGRAEATDQRHLHRRRALFLSDICLELKQAAPVPRAEAAPPLASVLRRAFDQPL